MPNDCPVSATPGRPPKLPVPPDIEILPVSRQRKDQLARDRLGLCISCGAPRQHYSKYCDRCHERRSDARDPLKKAHNRDFFERLGRIPVDHVWRILPGEYRPNDSTIRRMSRTLGFTLTFRIDGDQLTLIRLQ